MRISQTFALRDDLKKDMHKARKLEWTTVGYQASVILVMYLVMGSSQAMKTAWLEDALGILPSIAFLIATAIYNRPPNEEFPYGYHRVFSIAFLAGSIALFSMGIYLIIDSSSALIKMEHPTIGVKQIGGSVFWMGWIMIIALVYSSLPAVVLGRKKLPLAKKLHNKILFTDADGQKADYMTAFAAMVGITLVGFGWWWADSTAAILISLSVIRDGYKNLRGAILDIMDRRPVKVKGDEPDPLIDKIKEEVLSWDWVNDAEVRFREHGQVYFGEIIAVPNQNHPKLEERVEKGVEAVKKMDWKIHGVALTLASSIEKDTE